MAFREYDVNIDDFDPNGKYTSRQLDAYATAFLREDRRHHTTAENKKLGILLPDQLKKLENREVPVDATEIDGTLTNVMQDPQKPGVFKGDNQKMFGRSHPKGRRVNTDEQRSRGSSYYRG